MPEQQRLVHNRLAVLRAERGLSRKQLADKLGINYQTVGYIERGDYNPSLELALTIAELFRLPVEAIFQPQAAESVVGRKSSASPRAEVANRPSTRLSPGAAAASAAG